MACERWAAMAKLGRLFEWWLASRLRLRQPPFGGWFAIDKISQCFRGRVTMAEVAPATLPKK